MILRAKRAGRGSPVVERESSLGVPFLAPQPWAGGALPLQAAPLAEKLYSQEDSEALCPARVLFPGMGTAGRAQLDWAN